MRKKKNRDILEELHEEPMLVKDTSEKKYLSKEQFLEMRLHHFEMDVAKKELDNTLLNMKVLELQRILETHKRNDAANRIRILSERYKEFQDELKDQGLDIIKKTINPETFEILDD